MTYRYLGGNLENEVEVLKSEVEGLKKDIFQLQSKHLSLIEQRSSLLKENKDLRETAKIRSRELSHYQSRAITAENKLSEISSEKRGWV